MTAEQHKRILEELVVGDVKQYKNMCWVPVFGPDRFYEGFDIISEALATGEVDAFESGRISHIEITNRLEKKVFIPSGMILEGDTQNRASVYPILIPENKSSIRIPVNCAEEGQALVEGGRFDRADTMLIANARTGNIAQDRAWSAIGQTMMSFRHDSPTKDYVQVASGRRFKEFADKLGKPEDDQRGYIVAIREEENTFFYADIMGNNATYRMIHKMLHDSIAAVAKLHEGRLCKESKNTFRNFLKSAAGSDWVKRRVDHKIAGNVYVAKSPIEGCSFVYRKNPLQISLRKDVFKGSGIDPKQGQTMYFAPPQ